MVIIVLICKSKLKNKKKKKNYDDIDKITIEYLHWKKLFYKAYTLNSIKKNWCNINNNPNSNFSTSCFFLIIIIIIITYNRNGIKFSFW